jgi:hypothetical protein
MDIRDMVMIDNSFPHMAIILSFQFLVLGRGDEAGEADFEEDEFPHFE